MSNPELPVIQRTYDLLRWMSERESRFPRVHRDSLGALVLARLNDLFDLLLEAKYTRHREPLLVRANLLVEQLRFRVRLAFDLRSLRATGYGLDAIAWYGGNSGREYDLDEGENTSSWVEKQYPDTKAGTRRVGLKLANVWGLYDMLGNVWEWCLDGQREYGSGRVVDPAGSLEAGAARVIRGGNWNLSARNVRAAYREALQPGIRIDILGFRCLSSGR